MSEIGSVACANPEVVFRFCSRCVRASGRGQTESLTLANSGSHLVLLLEPDSPDRV